MSPQLSILENQYRSQVTQASSEISSVTFSDVGTVWSLDRVSWALEEQFSLPCTLPMVPVKH